MLYRSVSFLALILSVAASAPADDRIGWGLVEAVKSVDDKFYGAVKAAGAWGPAKTWNDRIKTTYDIAGNMLEESDYDGSGALRYRRKYLYDGQGRCTRMDNFGASGALSYYRIWKYDGNGREIEETGCKPDGSAQGSDAFAYDAE